jgi:hypothetical protein
MKIKTVTSSFPEKFDEIVNTYLAAGYRLNECGPRPLGAGGTSVLYARLVLREEDDE